MKLTPEELSRRIAKLEGYAKQEGYLTANNARPLNTPLAHEKTIATSSAEIKEEFFTVKVGSESPFARDDSGVSREGSPKDSMYGIMGVRIVFVDEALTAANAAILDRLKARGFLTVEIEGNKETFLVSEIAEAMPSSIVEDDGTTPVRGRAQGTPDWTAMPKGAVLQDGAGIKVSLSLDAATDNLAASQLTRVEFNAVRCPR